MYAVVGATGNTGRAVVKELKGLGENPVCVVRNADKAKEVLGADTKTAIAELDDRAGMQKALAGAKRVFIVTGHNPKSDVQQINVIEAAKAAAIAAVPIQPAARAPSTRCPRPIVTAPASGNSSAHCRIFRPGKS